MTKLFLKELSKIHPKKSKEYKQILDEYVSEVSLIFFMRSQKAQSPTEKDDFEKQISDINIKYLDKYKL
jgi:hypothetical protein